MSQSCCGTAPSANSPIAYGEIPSDASKLRHQDGASNVALNDVDKEADGTDLTTTSTSCDIRCCEDGLKPCDADTNSKGPSCCSSEDSKGLNDPTSLQKPITQKPCCDAQEQSSEPTINPACCGKTPDKVESCCGMKEKSPAIAPTSGCCQTVTKGVMCSDEPPKANSQARGSNIESLANTGSCCDARTEPSKCFGKAQETSCGAARSADAGMSCCTDDCITPLVIQECKETCGISRPVSSSVNSESALNEFQPCQSHVRSVFARYRGQLEKAMCLCKTVFSKTGKGCCRLPRSTHSQSVNARCSANKSTPKEREGCSKFCYSSNSVRNEPKESFCTKSACCDRTVSEDVIEVSCQKAPGPKAKCYEIPKSAMDDKLRGHDPERHGGPTNVQLQVDGMTCTSCSRKFEQGLKEIPGLANIRVNFVTGTADFDIDDDARADDVAREMEKKTGFFCAKINSDAQYIDLKFKDKHSTQSLPNIFPTGIHEVTWLDKQMVRVSYDVLLIGARSILNYFAQFGAELAPPCLDNHLQNGQKKLNDMAFKTVTAAVLTIPVCVLTWASIDISARSQYIASLILATGVQAIAIPEFYRPAFASLFRSRQVEMDMLVVISITAAYVYSVVAFAYIIVNHPLEVNPFFETSSLLVTFVLLGRLVAAYTRLRAVSAVSMRSLQAPSATLMDGKETRETDCRLLQFGDRFVVMPHSRVPTDGRILDGTSEVDESMLTGEAVPVTKKPGMDVIAGTMNCGGRLIVQLARLPGKNTLVDIAKLVDEASVSEPRAQDMADKVAGWFVCAIGIIAATVFLVWILVSRFVQGNTSFKAAIDAISYTIAVLAISCPCAIGLAVPMVLAIAGAVGARKGVVIKSAQSLAASARVTDVVFDKTGTLTTGELTVVHEELISLEQGSVRALTSALTIASSHPISKAVVKHLGPPKTKSTPALEEIRVIPGAGIEARLDGTAVRAGNPYWLGCVDHPIVTPLILHGMTILCVKEGTELKAVYGLTSQLRDEAIPVVRELRRRKIATHIISGDQEQAVHAVGLALDIPIENTLGRQSPAQKFAYVRDLASKGKTVLFIGDGTNDAVAIAAATVGVQLGSSSDVSRAIADVVLLGGLDGLIFLLDVGKAASVRVRFNFAWAAVYNFFAILLASGALVVVSIRPQYAGLGEMVSVLPVIFVAISMVQMLRGGRPLKASTS